MRQRILTDLEEVRAQPHAARGAGAGPRAQGDATSSAPTRARAVRLRRLPRPPGAPAQGRELLPAPPAPLRGPARRARRPVHRLRGRRRQAHAEPHLRPARASRASGAPARRSSRSRSTTSLRPRWTTSRRASSARGARIDVGPLPVVDGEPVLLIAVFQNLIGNALKFHGEDAAGRARQRRARWRDVDDHLPRRGDRHRPRVRGAHLRDLPAPAPQGVLRGHRASDWRSVARSSSITAAGSGSTPTCRPERRSGSPCPYAQRGAREWKASARDNSRNRAACFSSRTTRATR